MVSATPRVEFSYGYNSYTKVIERDLPCRLAVIASYKVDERIAYPWDLCIKAFVSMEQQLGITSIEYKYKNFHSQYGSWYRADGGYFPFPSFAFFRRPRCVSYEKLSSDKNDFGHPKPWKDLVDNQTGRQLNNQRERFPSQIIFKSGEDVVAKIHTEFWGSWGCEFEPYKDSTTLSVLCKDSSTRDQIRRIFFDAAAQLSITARDTLSFEEFVPINRAVGFNRVLNALTVWLAPITIIGYLAYTRTVSVGEIEYIFFSVFPFFRDCFIDHYFNFICAIAFILNGFVNAALFLLAVKFPPHHFSAWSRILSSSAILVSSMFINLWILP